MPPAPRVVVAHTADLDRATRDAAYALLDVVFAGELEADDWEHALGGIHAVAHDPEGAVIGHASVIQRRLVHGGAALRAGYVEGVGVHADHRRRGIAGLLMAPLERVIRNAYDLGALGATDEAVAFYTGRGWRRWEGEARAITPRGVVRTPDEEGAIYVLENPGRPLDLSAPLTCDWRDGDV